MMIDDQFLRDKHGELIRFADGSPIPHAAFENEPSDTYLYLYNRPLKERVEQMIKMGVPVPQRLLDRAGMTHTGEDNL